MLTLADGKQGLMNMGLVAGGVNRHTAFDSDVVFHEFTHGVSNRLVGGLLDNVLYKIAADNTVSVFMEQAGYTGNDVNNTGTQTRSGRSHVLLIGPSCAR